jgi:hypothetical protein
LLEFVGYGAMTEWAVLDDARELTQQPVGWELTGYLAEVGGRPVEGWDDFKGYYQGRTEVSD